MTAKSNVPGKTVNGAYRARAAEGRKAVHATRPLETQLRELDSRPGEALKERARLAVSDA